MRFTFATLCLLFIGSIYAISLPTVDELATMKSRRIDHIVKYNAANSTFFLNKWKTSLKENRTWADIDMTSGCGSRIANWPAQQHLTRVLNLAVGYYQTMQSEYLEKSLTALDYWLDNDFSEHDCIENGGVESMNCPCGTPGLWSKNWFNQLIAVPHAIGDTCLLLHNQLSDKQKKGCITIQERAFAKVTSMTQAISVLTAANLLDVSNIGITLAMIKNDVEMLQTALEAFYSGITISKTAAGDGIQADGSFIQHNGILYNGNYGKDFASDVLGVFTETVGLSIAPSDSIQAVFKTLMAGSEWMMIANTKYKQLLWQYSAIGRMVSFRFADKQSSGGVSLDLEEIAKSAKGSSTEKEMQVISDRLNAPPTGTANQGNLIGTRYFYNSDYMVHRTADYVVTLKMYSSRTINSECLNIQNPQGFHLSDGAIYNYLTGNEYVDSFGSWDWDLVPGITVDYQGTPTVCSKVKNKGKKKFVGGVTDENTGIAVMDYLNPLNGNLAFKKTVFFFPSGYAVQVGPTTSKNTTAELVTVLDQRLRNGNIYIAGEVKNTLMSYLSPKTNHIWHDNIGYYFPTAEDVYIDSKPRYTNWSEVGISIGTDPQQLWTSYIKHSKTNTSGLLTQYIVQPAISHAAFDANVAEGKMPIQLAFHASSPQVNAAYSPADKTIATAFWTAGTYSTPWSCTIKTDKPCVVLLKQLDKDNYRVTVSDPSQSLTSVKLTITMEGVTKSNTFSLPTGNQAGNGVAKTLAF